MDKEPVMNKRKVCSLCLSVRPLRKSHIFPEFCYKHIYDEKHRLISFEPGLPEEAVFEQKGYRERLLCDRCEQLLSKHYEKPFYEYWFSEAVQTQLKAKPRTLLTGINYCSFKLFHLSVLFRAAASEACEDVQLGSHYDNVRRMVLDRDPGAENEYPIVCSPIENPEQPGIWMDWVGAAHSVRLCSSRAYYFLFGGAQWFYCVSSHDDPEIRKMCLSSKGELLVMRTPLLMIPHHRRLRAQAKGKQG